MREPYYYCVTRQGTVDVPMSKLSLEVLRGIAAGSPVVYCGQQGAEEGLAFVRLYAGILAGERGPE